MGKLMRICRAQLLQLFWHMCPIYFKIGCCDTIQERENTILIFHPLHLEATLIEDF